MGKKSDAAERMAKACESMAAVFVEMSQRDKYVEELREQLGAAHARIIDLEKAEIEIEVLRDDNGRLAWLIEVLKKDLRKSEESEESEESEGLEEPGIVP